MESPRDDFQPVFLLKLMRKRNFNLDTKSEKRASFLKCVSAKQPPQLSFEISNAHQLRSKMEGINLRTKRNITQNKTKHAYHHNTMAKGQ